MAVVVPYRCNSVVGCFPKVSLFFSPFQLCAFLVSQLDITHYSVIEIKCN
jgi:hypothetical protein